jgi:hypothetical protein
MLDPAAVLCKPNSQALGCVRYGQKHEKKPGGARVRDCKASAEKTDTDKRHQIGIDKPGKSLIMSH